jgi:hypothetical protein
LNRILGLEKNTPDPLDGLRSDLAFNFCGLFLENLLQEFRKLIPRFLVSLGVILKREVELFPEPIGVGVRKAMLGPRVRNETIIGPDGFHLRLLSAMGAKTLYLPMKPSYVQI